MCIIFKDSIWVAKSWNIQNATLDMEKSLLQNVSAFERSKKPDLQTFHFLAAGSKGHGCIVNCQSLQDSLCYI
jgi:hypothetical protein